MVKKWKTTSISTSSSGIDGDRIGPNSPKNVINQGQGEDQGEDQGQININQEHKPELQSSLISTSSSQQSMDDGRIVINEETVYDSLPSRQPDRMILDLEKSQIEENNVYHELKEKLKGTWLFAIWEDIIKDFMPSNEKGIKTVWAIKELHDLKDVTDMA